MDKYIITAEDVNKMQRVLHCKCCGNATDIIYFSDILGRVTMQDVGKIAIKHGNTWQIENYEQFQKRIGKRS